MPEKSEIRIFLAHASEDKAQALQLYEHLKEVGYRPWLDVVDLMAGINWRAEIPRVIKESDIFILCLSKDTFGRKGYVQRELKLAVNAFTEKTTESVYLLPLKFDDFQVPDLLEEEYGINLKDIKHLNYYEPDGFRRLVNSIEYIRETLSSKEVAEEEPRSVEVSIEFPEDTSPERIRDAVRQTALAADAIHRSRGGNGLQIDEIKIFSSNRVPEGSSR